MDLAIEDDIEQYIVLIRRVPTAEMPGKDAWRIWVFRREDVDRGLVMPRFDAMELFANRKDAEDLLEKDRTAKAFAMQLED